MSLLLAIRRSYQHFIPDFIRNPRHIFRTLFSPALCFLMGISFGAELYADRNQTARIASLTVLATMALLVLNWWASRDDSSALSFVRGRTAVATLSLAFGLCFLLASAFMIAFQADSDFQSPFHALKNGILLLTIGLILPSAIRKAG